ncbi:30S ribosomal protein S6 [Bacillaceae bacterium]
MRKYEVMYILRPDLEEEKIKGNVERFKNFVTENGGEVTNLEEMGKRRLAYEIQKYREGYYVVMNFAASAEVVSEIGRLMRISDDILRHLIVREDE